MWVVAAVAEQRVEVKKERPVDDAETALAVLAQVETGAIVDDEQQSVVVVAEMMVQFSS
jgi:hypothetical protein